MYVLVGDGPWRRGEPGRSGRHLVARALAPGGPFTVEAAYWSRGRWWESPGRSGARPAGPALTDVACWAPLPDPPSPEALRERPPLPSGE